ncbi:MAG TPA: sugar transferase [Gammaproteobacteria bacterium]|jgi:lipopolysaccharide/colanic/teichoic acid biosynthesis glycosyltransferase|nr:sugar transferase [Gammaproteobacteria bacterium]
MTLSKRALDLALVIIAMPVLILVFLIVSLAIKMDDGGPVFFVQERVGHRGTMFQILKFRTMIENAERKGPLITVAGDARITRVGRWLRSSKFDELPQLINVLRGEMSLVGPRPEVPRYVRMYTTEQRKILDLKPGITDPASIHYLDESGVLATEAHPEKAYIERIMGDKIRMNLAYAKRANCMTDIRVILDTLLKLRS